jgi:hypothetical protein
MAQAVAMKRALVDNERSADTEFALVMVITLNAVKGTYTPPGWKVVTFALKAVLHVDHDDIARVLQTEEVGCEEHA